MRITCPGCSAAFNVDDGRVPPQGTTVRCPKCFKAVDVVPPSEAQSLDEAILGPGDAGADSFAGEFTQPDAAPVPAPARPGSRPLRETRDAAAAELPSTTHSRILDQGVVDDVWGGTSTGKARETALGVPAVDPGPDASRRDAPSESPASIFDADLSWSQTRQVRSSTGPEEPRGEDHPSPAPRSTVTGLGETALAPAPALDDLELALAGLEASAPVVSGLEPREEAPPAPGTGAGPGEPEFLDLGMEEPASGTGSKASLQTGMAFAPLDQVGDGSIDIQRETISRDGVGDAAPAAPARGEAAQRRFDGGGPTIDDIDFDSLLDDLPGDESGGDTFFVDSPEGGAAAAPGFEAPAAASGDGAFDMEEINFDNLDEFSDLGELSEAGQPSRAEKPPKSGEALELDMGEDAAHAPSQGVAAPRPRGPAPATTAEPVERRRGQRKRTSKSALTLLLILALGAVAVLLFGDGLLSLLPGGDGPVNRQRSDDREKKAAYTRGSLEYPTREEYERRAETLEKEIELGKGSRTELEEELLWLLAWYHMTMPGAFPEGSPRTARLAALRKQHAGEGTVFADKLVAMDFVAEERWSQARTAYERYLKLRNSRLDELLSTGKLNPAMVQEDVLLQAWILCELKETGRASELLRGFLEKQPGSLLGLFLDARIRYRAGELALAEAALGKVLDRYPTHATSKALLAEVEIEQGKHGEAAEHARALVEAAVQQKDEALEMQAYRIMVRALHLQGEAGRPQLQEVLEGVVKKRSNAEEMVVALARIYLEADDAEKALTTLSLCKECRGSEFRLLQVRSMYRNDMMERALQTAQEVLEQDKDNIELLIVMAEISEKTGRHNSAMDYLRDVLRLRPDLLDASLRLARLYLSLQQPPNAREVLLEAEKYHAEDLQLEQMLAQINLEMNDDSGAAAALRKLHRMKPEDTEIRLRLVEILIRLGNYKEAVPHFDALAEKNLISTRLRPGYAMSLREVGRMDDAVEMLKAVLRDDPSDYQTARNLATIFLDKKDFFKAREYLEMARRSRSNEAEVHFLIGTCCVETGDLECAVEAFTQAVELEKQNLLYRTEYAKIIYRLAQSDEQRRDSLELMARSQFDQIIQRYETDPSIPAGRKDPDIYANRGRIWFRMGYYDKALADFRVAVAMDQLRADLLLNMGDSLFHVNKREDAKNYYREVLESGQNLAHANFYLGKIFMVEGNPKKAKAYFLATIDADYRKFPDAHRFLGNIYKEERFIDMAVKYYRNYLDMVDPSSPQARDVANTIERLR